MNNRASLVLGLLGLVLVCRSAGQTQHHVFDGDFTNGLRLELTFAGNCPVPATADEIWYQFISKTNVFRIFIPKPSCFCTIELIGTNGQSVAKSSLGKRYGARFTKAPGFDWDSKWSSMAKDRDGTASHVFAGPHGGGSAHFWRCEDLFRVREPGDYKLRIQFQAFQEVNFPERHKREIRLIRFPPFEINVRGVKKQ